MKTRVVFDTNLLYKDIEKDVDKIFTLGLKNILDFKLQHDIKDIEICIPEVVVEERLIQQNIIINGMRDSVDEKIKELKKVNQKYTKAKKNPSIMAVIRRNTNSYIKKHSIIKIPIPKISQKELIGRAVNKKKPFSNEGDKGFKDTLIWLSLLEDAKKNVKSDYVFCTENIKDFDIIELKKEFKNSSKRNFIIITSFQDLKEYLDNKYVLELDLKEKYKKIEAGIKNNIGSLMVKVNSFRTKSQNKNRLSYRRSPVYQTIPTISAYTNGRKDIIQDAEGFDFKDIDIDNISEIVPDNFEIDINLEVVTRFSDDKIKQKYIRPNYLLSSFGKSESLISNLKIKLVYDFKNETFIISDIFSYGNSLPWNDYPDW